MVQSGGGRSILEANQLLLQGISEIRWHNIAHAASPTRHPTPLVPPEAQDTDQLNAQHPLTSDGGTQQVI